MEGFFQRMQGIIRANKAPCRNRGCSTVQIRCHQARAEATSQAGNQGGTESQKLIVSLQQLSFANPVFHKGQSAESRIPFRCRNQLTLIKKGLLQLGRHGQQQVPIPENHGTFRKPVGLVYARSMVLDPTFQLIGHATCFRKPVHRHVFASTIQQVFGIDHTPMRKLSALADSINVLANGI